MRISVRYDAEKEYGQGSRIPDYWLLTQGSTHNGIGLGRSGSMGLFVTNNFPDTRGTITGIMNCINLNWGGDDPRTSTGSRQTICH